MTGDTASCSVATYVRLITEKPEGGAYDNVKPLVRAMASYGAYAMNYFHYEAKNPDTRENANAIVAQPVTGTADDLYEYRARMNGSLPEGLSITGIFLSLETETAINVRLNLTGGHQISEYTFTLGNQPLTPMKSGSTYILVIPNIAAQHLDKEYTVQIGICSVTFTALSYTYSTLKLYQNESNQAALCDTVRALWAYNKEADNYFA